MNRAHLPAARTPERPQPLARAASRHRPCRGWGRAALTPLVLLALFLGSAGSPSTAQAQGAGGADLLQGFDAPLPGAPPGAEPGAGASPPADSLEAGFAADLPPAEPTADGQNPPASPWSLGGFVRLDGAYAYAHDPPAPGQPGRPSPPDDRGWSKLRLAVQLELTLQLSEDWRAFVSGQAFRDFAYQRKGEEHFTPEVLAAYQDEGELREAWVRGTPTRSLDFKLGRQVVVWGKSDNLRVVDVLNPLDLREPGLTDLEDLRLPLTMTRVDYFLGDWAMTAVAVHEIRFDKQPVRGNDFYPLPLQVPSPLEEVPQDGGRNTEWGASLSGIFSGWDLALYWAEVFDDQGYLTDADNNLFTDFQALRKHARVHMSGAAVNVALGNLLLKGEAATFSGLRFFNQPQRTFRRVDGMLGLEYSGFTDVTLALEGVNRHLLDFDLALERSPDGAVEDTIQYVLSFRGSYLRETLDLIAAWNAFGANGELGTAQRYQVTYELLPALDVTGGVVLYTAGEATAGPIANAKDNDRLFFETKWNF